MLLGHIQLHGLQEPEQAAISYERVLQGDVEATIAALAEQGLKRCRSEDITSGTDTAPATNGAIPDLLKDPFLSTDPDPAKPAPADVVTAMPWLTSDEEPLAMPIQIPLPLRLLCRILSQAQSQRSARKPIHRPRYRSRNQNPLQKNHPSTQSSERPNPRSLRPRNFWNTHGSAFNSSPTSKAPPTPWSRWG